MNLPNPDDQGPGRRGAPAARARGRRVVAGLALAAGALGIIAACTIAPAPTGDGGPAPIVVLGPAVSSTRPAAPAPTPTTMTPTTTPATTPTPTRVSAARTPNIAAKPVLRGDGLGVVKLGEREDRALAALEAAFGPADFDTGWDQGLRSLNFGLLYVEFHEDEGLRTFAGAYYTLPDATNPTTTPNLDTAAPLGLGLGQPVTYAQFAASGAPAAPIADHAGATCVTAPGGPVCAYVDEPQVDAGGANIAPAPTARVVAVVLGRIRPFGHCGV